MLGSRAGLTLEETPTGQIIVASVIAGSNAERSGRICQGMRLIATSAVIYKSEKVGECIYVGLYELIPAPLSLLRVI